MRCGRAATPSPIRRQDWARGATGAVGAHHSFMMRVLRSIGEACVLLVAAYYLFTIGLLVLIALVAVGVAAARGMDSPRRSLRRRQGESMLAAAGVAVTASVAAAQSAEEPTPEKQGVEGVDKPLWRQVVDFAFGPAPPSPLDVEYARARGEPLVDRTVTGNARRADIAIALFFALSPIGTTLLVGPWMAQSFDSPLAQLLLVRFPPCFTLVFFLLPALRWWRLKRKRAAAATPPFWRVPPRDER
jgi:hypothetical protein